MYVCLIYYQFDLTCYYTAGGHAPSRPAKLAKKSRVSRTLRILLRYEVQTEAMRRALLPSVSGTARAEKKPQLLCNLSLLQAALLVQSRECLESRFSFSQFLC